MINKFKELSEFNYKVLATKQTSKGKLLTRPYLIKEYEAMQKIVEYRQKEGWNVVVTNILFNTNNR